MWSGFKFGGFFRTGSWCAQQGHWHKKKVVVLNCRSFASPGGGRTRQAGETARGRRGQQITKRNSQRTTSGLCNFACAAAFADMHYWEASEDALRFNLPTDSSAKAKKMLLSSVYPRLRSCCMFSRSLYFARNRSWRSQALPFACAFFVKGYVQEDVLSGTKMLPNFKLRALNMPKCRNFGHHLAFFCDATFLSFHGHTKSQKSK